jgi:hypothetical protein
VRRPNPFQWLWYTFGGRLSQRYREWVLHDVTCRTWFLRHLIRAVVLVMPMLVLMYLVFGVFLDGPGYIVWMSLSLGLIVGVYYALSYAPESADARLDRYGFPAGHATEVRRAAHEDRNREATVRYQQQWRDADAG